MTCIRRNLDTQNCCNQWQKGIRTIDGQYPDDNREFTIQAGSNISVTPITAGIEISASIPSVPGPMVFKGTLGTGGTITTLPPATSTNIGNVYVAIESGTVPVTYETGDMCISNGITWVVVPSGDDMLPIVISWQATPDNAHIPSEKLVKDSIDPLVTTEATNQYIQGTKQFGSAVVAPSYQSVNDLSTGLVMMRSSPSEVKARVEADYEGKIKLSPGLGTGDVKSVQIVNQRAYDPANVDDVATIATIDAYTPMVRTTGNQTIAGTKDCTGIFRFTNYVPSFKRVTRAPDGAYAWWKVYTADASAFSFHTAIFQIFANRNNVGMIRLALSSSSNITINRLNGDNYPSNSICVTVDNNNLMTVWIKRIDSSARMVSQVTFEGTVNFALENILQASTDGAQYDEPDAGDYAYKVVG